MTNLIADTSRHKGARTEALSTGSPNPSALARKVLNAASQSWFLVAVIGQWAFVYYVASFYVGSAVQGNFETWNKVLPHGYMPGETLGNVAVAAHVFLAVIIIGGGPLQLIARVRAYAPAVHRWNGRIYIPFVFATSLAGLTMLWTRGTVGGLPMHIGLSLDAILIMIFAVLAWRYARVCDFTTHRRWALRLFMVVNGVWFFRVGLMLWIFLNNGPAGFDPKTFRGPFLTFLSFANYLLPLAVLEVYLRTKDRAGTLGRFAMAAGLFVLTLAMGVGIIMATVGLWLPRL